MAVGRPGHLVASPSTPEEDAWLDDLVDRLARPTSSELLFYQRRQALGLGCGLDAAGNLVYANQSPGSGSDLKRFARATASRASARMQATAFRLQASAVVWPTCCDPAQQIGLT